MWGQVLGDKGFHVMAYDVPVQMPWDQGQNSFFGVVWVLDVVADHDAS